MALLDVEPLAAAQGLLPEADLAGLPPLLDVAEMGVLVAEEVREVFSAIGCWLLLTPRENKPGLICAYRAIHTTVCSAPISTLPFEKLKGFLWEEMNLFSTGNMCLTETHEKSQTHILQTSLHGRYSTR